MNIPKTIFSYCNFKSSCAVLADLKKKSSLILRILVVESPPSLGFQFSSMSLKLIVNCLVKESPSASVILTLML